MKNRNGFTIMELLVIIAILGVLAAIVIPNISSILLKEDYTYTEYQYKLVDEKDKLYYCNEYDLTSERPYITDAYVKIDRVWEKVRAYLFPCETGVAVIENEFWQPGLEDDDSFTIDVPGYETQEY